MNPLSIRVIAAILALVFAGCSSSSSVATVMDLPARGETHCLIRGERLEIQNSGPGGIDVEIESIPVAGANPRVTATTSMHMTSGAHAELGLEPELEHALILMPGTSEARVYMVVTGGDETSVETRRADRAATR